MDVNMRTDTDLAIKWISIPMESRHRITLLVQEEYGMCPASFIDAWMQNHYNAAYKADNYHPHSYNYYQFADQSKYVEFCLQWM